MDELLQYFPHLTAQQREQFAALDALYRDWNAKINVISRKDIDNLYPHHVLHSLGIAKVISRYSFGHIVSRSAVSFGRLHREKSESGGSSGRSHRIEKCGLLAQKRDGGEGQI